MPVSHQILQGICLILQCVYINLYPKDPLWTKVRVILLALYPPPYFPPGPPCLPTTSQTIVHLCCLVTAFQTCQQSLCQWETFVQYYGDATGISRHGWVLHSQSALNGVVTMLVQVMYVQRLYTVSLDMYLPAGPCATSLIQPELPNDSCTTGTSTS
jgi:hypothetical protein